MLHLVAHDKDQFNRWESVQKLVTKVIGIIAQIRQQTMMALFGRLPMRYHRALQTRHLTNSRQGFGAATDFGARNVMHPADPVALHKARAATQASLGRLLADDIAAFCRRL